MEMHNPAHPGAVLKEGLADISVTAAAERLGVSRLALSKALNENGGTSPDMDLRLSKALCTSQGFWYRMQAQWDMAQDKRRFKAKVKPIPRAELQSGSPA